MTEDLLEPLVIADELHGLAAPIRERLERVEQELATALAVVDGLRAGRAQLRKALAAVDPTFEPESRSGPKSNGKRTTPKLAASEGAIARAMDYFEANRAELSNGNGMTSGSLNRRADWPFSESYTKVILDTLHDRGVVRLDRKGRGGAHIFVLV